MKSLKLNLTIPLLLLLFSIIVISGCTSSRSLTDRAGNTKELLYSQNFQFNLEYIPALGASRNLANSGYTLKVSKQQVTSYLPFFGRAYVARPGDEQGMKFTSTDFTYTVTEKKRGWDVMIEPNDVTDIQFIMLNVSKSGKTLVNITSNSRQAISYSGDIVKSEQPVK